MTVEQETIERLATFLADRVTNAIVNYRMGNTMKEALEKSATTRGQIRQLLESELRNS